ncbi:MAG: hypothetical protein H6737_27435 [Alphaproteobacteria bacterium]|nr:hypothetical protein [Alphaproteobacteria bacterium]
MRSLALFGLLATAPAYAGGIGLIGNAGIHTEKVYFYSDHTVDGGLQIEDEANYEQLLQRQALFNGGGGVEFLLGDRDERIQGVFRLFYNADTPQADPASRTTLVAPENVISRHRDTVKHTGMATMGLNWGIVGSPDNFQAGLSVHVGSGFLTNDRTEFLIAQIGPTVNYRVARQVILFGDVQYAARFRKEFSQGTLVTAGVRYMFD